jgi:O-methyltransferase
MRTLRSFSPDFKIGKLILIRRMIFDAILMIIRTPTKETLQIIRLIFQVKPEYTMSMNGSLVTLYHLTQKINNLNIPGDIVECGVWNGGSAAVMGVAYMKNQAPINQRSIWLFDSFQGLPPPGEKDDDFEKNFYFEGWNKGDIRKVKRIFNRLKLPLDKVKIIPGWFDATIKTAPIEQIAILNIDADWYDSVKLVLDVFYEKVVPGGFIVLDDYIHWKGCDRAVADYFAEHGIKNVNLEQINREGGAYFQKPL